MDARTCAAVWVQGKGGNGWEEGPVGMSERGCADVCGGVGAREGSKWVGRRPGGHERAWMRRGVRTVRVQWNGWKEGPVGMSKRGCADVCGGVGAREGWKWVGRRPGGHERAWMRRGVRTARVQWNGWKEGPVGMSKRGCADVCCVCKGKGGSELAEGPVGERRWKWAGRRPGGHEYVWMGKRVQGKWVEMGGEKAPQP